MKDRFPLDRWPSDWIAKVFADFPKVSRETRIFLAKAIRILAEAQYNRGVTVAPSGPTDENAG
jgi:hypothetical protein